MTDALTASTVAARLGLDLPASSGPLPVRCCEDRVEDGCALMRTAGGPPAEMVVVHDGSGQGIAEAGRYACPLKLAPTMLALLVEALGAWEEQFDGLGEGDECVPGSDMVEWFASWRRQVRAALAASAAVR